LVYRARLVGLREGFRHPKDTSSSLSQYNRNILDGLLLCRGYVTFSNYVDGLGTRAVIFTSARLLQNPNFKKPPTGASKKETTARTCLKSSGYARVITLKGPPCPLRGALQGYHFCTNSPQHPSQELTHRSAPCEKLS
jgi:hypothetical protein